MGPVKNKAASGNITMFWKKYLNRTYLTKLVFDPEHIFFVCWCLLTFEVILNVFIIQRINYTEIDWIAYMQEVEGFINGTLDYQYLKGDTGPLVYPAGFVYIYTAFYYITSFGQNIRLAQYIFLVIYLLQLYFTFEIFKKTCKIPPYALALSILTSYRIHSIYVLRLFNDPIAVLLFYISLNAFLKGKWYLGSVLYSLAVSVKMNILLYAPCLLTAYLTNLNYISTFKNLFICGLVQLILGAPFLYGNFISYIRGSFDLGRIFEHKWTVNYRFLDRATFENKGFHIFLLTLHILLLILFLPVVKRYLSSYSKLNGMINYFKTEKSSKKTKSSLKKPKAAGKEQKLDEDQEKFVRSFETMLHKNAGPRNRTNAASRASEQKTVHFAPEEDDKRELNCSKMTQLFVLPFFVTNLIGIACARSLHYQFYSWYFNSLIYLVHCTTFRKSVMFLILGIIEFCWNTYPSTDISSASLHCCHIILLYGLYKYMRQ